VRRQPIDHSPPRIDPRLALLVVAASVLACAGNPRPERRTASEHPDSIGCLDTLRARDSVTRIVKLSVSPRDTGVTLPTDFEDLFAEEFRRRFRLPPEMALSVVAGVPPCDSLASRCVAGVLDVGAYAYATVHNDGKLTDISVLDVGLTPSFADSVASVLSAISKESMAPSVGGKVDSIPLVLQLTTSEPSDSGSPYRRILRLTVPLYEMPFSYASMPAGGVNAKYPFAARLAGVEDSVAVAFTVNSDGLIPAESIELVSATYRDFVTSVAEALLETKYHPARLGDCAVATRMEQRFLFKVPE
jgi:hypothetical protein